MAANKRHLLSYGHIALLALALGACAPTPPPPTSSRPMTNSAVSTEACRDKGGQIQRVCMMGNEMCVVHFADADKPCTDGSQCQSGQCLASDKAWQSPKDSVSGTCKDSNNPCGCFTTVENGQLGHTLCVD